MLLWLFQNAVIAGALAALVALAGRFCRLSPPVRYALWLIVLLKLVTPPLGLWSWTVPGLPPHLFAVFDPSQRQPAAAAPAFDNAGQDAANLPPASLARHDITGLGPAARTGVHGRASAPSGPGLPLVLLHIWWLALAAAAAVQLVRLVRFKRLVVRSQRPPAWLTARLNGEAERLGVRPPRLVVLAGAREPVLWCFGKPILVWPAGLVERFEAGCGPGILVHELAHLRRRDHWVCWIRLAAGCLWWWYPLYWFAERKLDENAELACDAWVVWAQPDRRFAYAEAVVDIWKQGPFAAPMMPAFAAGRSARTSLERRLAMIVRANAPRRVSARVKVLVVLLAAIAIPAWLQPQETEQSRSRDDGNATVRSESRDGERAIRADSRDGKAVERPRTRDGDRSMVRSRRDGEGPARRIARDDDRPAARDSQGRERYGAGGSFYGESGGGGYGATRGSEAARGGYSVGGFSRYGGSGGGGYGATRGSQAARGGYGAGGSSYGGPEEGYALGGYSQGRSSGRYGSTAASEAAQAALRDFRPQNAREAALLQMIRQLQREMAQLRREMNQLRAGRSGYGFRGREGASTNDRLRGEEAFGDVLVRPGGPGADAPREGSRLRERPRRRTDIPEEGVSEGVGEEERPPTRVRSTRDREGTTRNPWPSSTRDTGASDRPRESEPAGR